MSSVVSTICRRSSRNVAPGSSPEKGGGRGPEWPRLDRSHSGSPSTPHVVLVRRVGRSAITLRLLLLFSVFPDERRLLADRRVRAECVLLRPRIRVAVLLGQPDLSQTLLLALAAAPRPADGVVQLLDRIGGLLGLALVRP